MICFVLTQAIHPIIKLNVLIYGLHFLSTIFILATFFMPCCSFVVRALLPMSLSANDSKFWLLKVLEFMCGQLKCYAKGHYFSKGRGHLDMDGKGQNCMFMIVACTRIMSVQITIYSILSAQWLWMLTFGLNLKPSIVMVASQDEGKVRSSVDKQKCTLLFIMTINRLFYIYTFIFFISRT